MTPKSSFSFAEEFRENLNPLLRRNTQIEDTDKTNCKQKKAARINSQLVKWSKEEDSLIKQHIQLGRQKRFH